jgi:hypothetical protein
VIGDAVVGTARATVVGAAGGTLARAASENGAGEAPDVVATDAVGVFGEVGGGERRLEISAVGAEPIVRRLLAADDQLRELEVGRAGLAEAFVQITKEAA